ncbi:hypothetical protein C922_01214 [Plasmodium inui San Antonio 1]|uniref:subtilisin n=1 Tax=Plasmodium inui San Antonio 1 TaxID=1237626 RepID=W7ART7_9APIC|nr:hypothetical protein C922_01214 [Plasmodium inui San Antonio 1]EUD68196.1 hypothetical protein C922_01214 [Plasmodium inui San Antonio 1]
MTIRKYHYALVCLLISGMVNHMPVQYRRHLMRDVTARRKHRTVRDDCGEGRVSLFCFHEEPHLLDEILTKRGGEKMIIKFKQKENAPHSALIQENIVNLLGSCGRVKKLSHIDLYLYETFSNISQRAMKNCLQLLSSGGMLVEQDFQIHPAEGGGCMSRMVDGGDIIDRGGFIAIGAIGGEAPVSSGGNLRSHPGSDGTFHLNNQIAFKKFVKRLQTDKKGTNIIHGYDQTKMKEGTELSEPYEQNDVDVCIVDTGVDYDHRDLRGNISLVLHGGDVREGHNGSGGDGRDPDESIGDDGHCRHHPRGMDNHGHGTFIAGIIAGNSQRNSQGIKGICRRAKLTICKALNSENAGFISDILKCFNFCASKKAKIINASFASTKNYLSLFEALKTLEEKNILVVSSSGNCCPTPESKNTFPECNLDVKKVYPTAYSTQLRNLITVSNMIQRGNGEVSLSPDSCYSANYVHLAAPGDDIISTFPQNKYAISSGSSFSAAVVTGLAALVLSINADLNYEEVIVLLRGSIVQVESLGSRVKWGGFLDVRHLVSATIALSRGMAEEARD